MSISLSCCPTVVIYAVGEGEGVPGPRAQFRMTAPTPASNEPPDDRGQVDAQLVRRMAGGDKQALAELYDRFSNPLYGTALRILRDSAEAQDVVHDAFVTLWEKAPSFDSQRGTAFAWALTLVRNRAIDRVRMRRRRSELLAASVPEDLGFAEGQAGGGDQSAERSDEAVRVRAAVDKLPLEQKRALELAFFGGLTQEEIARTLSEPLGTVKARIRRGLLKLRDSLALRS
jgi:RNA polymerase sigma-70 factor (ECF subfamily)